MILLPSQKLNSQIKGGTLGVEPRHENPLLDWSAQTFAVERAESMLLSSTPPRYSAALDRAAIRDAARFKDATELLLGK